ncbi:MAG: hypothetical protein WBG92_16030 [Thiohalocapsa sp.]
MPMLQYLIAILALAALCSGWVLFQHWLKQADPDARGIEDASGCRGHCGREGKAGPVARRVRFPGVS